MDFGEILSQWEKEQARRGGRSRDGRSESPHGEESRARHDLRAGYRSAGRHALRRMAPQARLDLHGMTASEAEAALRGFLAESRRCGLRKVLIIHGKGNHSSGEPVLGNAVRRVLEHCSFAGEFGEADRSLGGRGALWVILR